MTEPSEVEVRAATERDLPGIRSCLATAFEPYREAYTAEAFLDTVLTERSARERLGSMTVLVAVDRHDRVVGTVSFRRSSEAEGHLRGMAVLPEVQGSGVAAALLARAVAGVAALGCRRVTLGTTEPLARASRFYEKHGFRRTGTETNFFGMRLIEFAMTV
jgi:N-acetylglutamate synthase-like GNAT family acetyltransferase